MIEEVFFRREECTFCRCEWWFLMGSSVSNVSVHADFRKWKTESWRPSPSHQRQRKKTSNESVGGWGVCDEETCESLLMVEIRRSPVEVGSLFHFLPGFYASQVVQDSFHQQYHLPSFSTCFFFSLLKHENLLIRILRFLLQVADGGIYNYTCCSFLNVLLMLRQPQIWSIGWMGRWKKQKDEKWPLLSDQQNVSLSWVPFPGGLDHLSIDTSTEQNLW